jgi:hypothetical protein
MASASPLEHLERRIVGRRTRQGVSWIAQPKVDLLGAILHPHALDRQASKLADRRAMPLERLEDDGRQVFDRRETRRCVGGGLWVAGDILSLVIRGTKKRPGDRGVKDGVFVIRRQVVMAKDGVDPFGKGSELPSQAQGWAKGGSARSCSMPSVAPSKTYLRIASGDVDAEKDPRLLVVPEHAQGAEADGERRRLTDGVSEIGLELRPLLLTNVERPAERDVNLGWRARLGG